MIVDVILTGVVALILMKLWQKFIKRKVIWIIDDSELDQSLLRMGLKLNTEVYDVRYFNSAEGLSWKMLVNPPDAVICDYYLADNVNGDQVYKFFKRNNVNTILITGHDGDIAGVPKDAIYQKSADRSFYESLEQWIVGVTA